MSEQANSATTINAIAKSTNDAKKKKMKQTIPVDKNATTLGNEINKYTAKLIFSNVCQYNNDKDEYVYGLFDASGPFPLFIDFANDGHVINYEAPTPENLTNIKLKLNIKTDINWKELFDINSAPDIRHYFVAYYYMILPLYKIKIPSYKEAWKFIGYVIKYMRDMRDVPESELSQVDFYNSHKTNFVTKQLLKQEEPLDNKVWITTLTTAFMTNTGKQIYYHYLPHTDSCISKKFAIIHMIGSLTGDERVEMAFWTPEERHIALTCMQKSVELFTMPDGIVYFPVFRF